jgi:hypothetical protein
MMVMLVMNVIMILTLTLQEKNIENCVLFGDSECGSNK